MSCTEEGEGDGESVAKIEVYEFPPECVLEELRLHFETGPFSAHCHTTEQEAWDKERNTFVLEFAKKDAANILTQPVQILDEDDKCEIKLRPYPPPITQLQLCSEKPINCRLIKRCFKKHNLGNVKSCEKVGVDGLCHVVTLSSAAEAAALADRPVIQLDKTLTVQVQLYFKAEQSVVKKTSTPTNQLGASSLQTALTPSVSSGSLESLQSHEDSLNKFDEGSSLKQTISTKFEHTPSDRPSALVSDHQSLDELASEEQGFLIAEPLITTLKEVASDKQGAVSHNYQHQLEVIPELKMQNIEEQSSSHQNSGEQTAEDYVSGEQYPENQKPEEWNVENQKPGKQCLEKHKPIEQNPPKQEHGELNSENREPGENIQEQGEPEKEIQEKLALCEQSLEKQQLGDGDQERQKPSEGNAGQQSDEPEVEKQDAGDQYSEKLRIKEQVSAEQVQVKQVSAEQVPAERVQAKRVPAEQVPAEQVSAERVSAEQVPAEQVPAEQVQANQVPAEQVPAERVPAKRVQAERVPAEQVSAEQVPAEQVSAERVSAKQVPAEQVSAKQIQAEQVPAEQVPAEQVLAEQVPAEQVPAEQIQAEQVPAEQVPAEQVPAEQVPAEQVQAEQVPAEQVSAEQVPAEQVQAEQVPAEWVQAEQVPTERVSAEQVQAERVLAEQVPAEQVPAEQVPAEPVPAEQGSVGQNLNKLELDEPNSEKEEPNEQIIKTQRFEKKKSGKQELDGQDAGKHRLDGKAPVEPKLAGQYSGEHELGEQDLGEEGIGRQNLEKHKADGQDPGNQKVDGQDSENKAPSGQNPEMQGLQEPQVPNKENPQKLITEMSAGEPSPERQSLTEQIPETQGLRGSDPGKLGFGCQDPEKELLGGQSPVDQGHAEQILQDPKLENREPTNQSPEESKPVGQTTVVGVGGRIHIEQSLDDQEPARQGQKNQKGDPQLEANLILGNLRSAESSVASNNQEAQKLMNQEMLNRRLEEQGSETLSFINQQPVERASTPPQPAKRPSLQQPPHQKPVPVKRPSKELVTAKSSSSAKTSEMHTDVEAPERMSASHTGQLAKLPKSDGYEATSATTNLSLSIESLTDEEPKDCPTHIEVDILPNTSSEDMYSLLQLQLYEVLGDQFVVTKLPHSYDQTKKVFRFDMSVEEAEKLLTGKQMLFEDEEDSTLTIRPLYTGKEVVMKVVDKPAKAGLSKAHLKLHFGENSPFCTTLSFVQLKPHLAVVETESCSVASLIVSIGSHTLENKIVVKAYFPSADKGGDSIDVPSLTATDKEKINASQMRRTVLVETAVSDVVVKKYIRSKSKGTLKKMLSDGRYLVEYETDQVAEEVVKQQSHKVSGGELKMSFYVPSEDEEKPESDQESDEEKETTLTTSSMSSKDNIKYSKEFLLEFKDFYDMSPFARVSFPSEILSPAAIKQRKPQITPRKTFAAPAPVVEEEISWKSLLVSNLLDCDAQTLFFWVKTVFGVWPMSVQIAASEEQAVVKIPEESEIDEKKLKAASTAHFLLHGERLNVKVVPPTNSIQVICSSNKADAVINDSTLRVYFSNPSCTGVPHTSSLKSVARTGAIDNSPVYTLTYSHPQDVQNVISRKNHQLGDWMFDVAESYPDIGVCVPGSVTMFEDIGSLQAEVKKSPKTPKLYINDVNLRIINETLKMFMGQRKRCNGGEIDSWSIKPTSKDLHRVQITYKDPQVAQRVYDTYQQRGLKFGNHDLELELELPWLTEHHDDKKVRVSGLTNELDPEKLKFYLSALSDNVVTEMFFDESQTRAVAVFKCSLAEGFGDFVALQHQVSLKGYPELKITPELKCFSLITTGKGLCKEEIEVQIESLLEKKFKREVDVHADEYPGTTDTWKIVTEHQVLPYILENKHQLKRLDSLDPFSDFLGIYVTSGFHNKTENITNLIADPLVLEFLSKSQLMWKELSGHLKGLGMMLLDDGAITTNPGAGKKEHKTALKNWRVLRESLEKFLKRRTLRFNTGRLTQQVFSRVKDSVTSIVSGVSVVVEVKDDNELVFVGERNAVEGMRVRFDQMVKQIEEAIHEEQSVVEVAIPNIPGYQAEYLSLVRFFERLCSDNKLKSFRYDTANQCAAIKGLPADVDQVQKEMFALLPKITNSKISVKKKAPFITVFKTESASQSFRQQLLMSKVSAVWTVENKTISIYSESKEMSQSALECMNNVVWEGSYPNDRDFDDLEMKLLQSPVWKTKKTTLTQMCQPLELVDPVGQGRLVMYGLAQTKAIVVEEIPYFFESNVERTGTLDGVRGKIRFLNKYKEDVLKNLSQQHNVVIKATHRANSIEIIGTVDNIANCKRSLKRYHDLVCTDTHTIDHMAMVQKINEDPEILDTVGLKTRCLVVLHQEEPETTPAAPLVYSGRGGTIIHFTMKLSSKVVCEGHRGDITSVSCDAIVNAANGDLQHVGGLAHAIVQRGGSSIQQECNHFTRRNGQLMEGQVFTSSPGTLSCKKIIHAVGPRWKGGHAGEELALYNCIDNTFDEIKTHKLRSVAIPPISTGIFGYPLDKAVKTIVEVVHDRHQQGDYLPPKIIFVDNQDSSMKHFQRQLTEKFQKPVATPVAAPRAQPGPPTAPSTQNTDYTINGRNILVQNKVNIEIKHGDITTAQEESLVNSAGKELNLNQGMISQALLKKAGPQLQKACSKIAPLGVCDVKETDGFGLPCQKVLHCICPGWKGPQTLSHLKMVVIRCLKLAASFGHASIAFPALGTGNLQYPVDDAADAMVAAIISYATKNPTSSLRDVKIVIYYADKPTQQAFDAVLQQLTQATNATSLNLTPKNVARKTSAPKSDIDVKGCVQVNDAFVRVVQGSLTDHKADVLVNSTDGQLNMGGQVSRALLKQAGLSVGEEIDELRTNPSEGGVWVSNAGQLKAKRIFHINSDLPQGKHDGWVQLISNCLALCDQNGMKSIAFPAIGTGVLNMDAKCMAKNILKAVVSYLSKNPQSTLRRVDLVIFLPAMVDDFVSSLKKAVEQKTRWWNIPMRVFNFIASKFDSAAGIGEDSYAPSSKKVKLGTLHISEDGLDEELSLDIFANSKEDIRRCKEDIEKTLQGFLYTVMWKNKPTYEEDKENIAKLTEEQVDKLRDLARDFKVKLTVDQRVRDIKLNGLTKNVLKMSDHVAAELKGIDKEVQEQKEAELMAKTVQWTYDSGAGTRGKFEETINKRIEETYQDNPQGSVKYDTDNGKVTIDLATMQGHTSKTTFEIKREDLQMTGAAAVMKVPDTWQAPKDVYKEFPLTAATPEYQRVENNFMKTLGQGGNRVLEIRRIQNPPLYQQYCIMRSDAAKRLGQTDDKVETILWHGTDADTVSKIASGKFDRGMAGRNATMYGAGSYFATTTAYSSRYAAPNPQGHKFIIQTRVVTGEWCQGNQGLKSAPYKNNVTEQYDSVVDNMNNPTIYVVFNDASAYPEYIVKFQ